MKKAVLSLISALTVFSLFGCSTTGPVYTPAIVQGGKSVVYFYRPDKFTLSGRTIFMTFPGSNKSYSMINNGYYPLVTDSGTVTVYAVGTDIKPVPFKIDVKKGENRFVKVIFADTMALLVPAEMQEVPAATGKNEITGCTLITVSD